MKLLSVFLYSLATSTATAQHALHPRQTSASSNDVSSTISSTGTTTPIQTSSESATKSSGSGISSAAVSSSASSLVPSITDGSTLASGTSNGRQVTPTISANDTTRGDPVPLPLQPKITPAIGFAGAVLMITGLAYTLVGIKNQWLYSFFGVAYLVSLATTVLIIYCMNPPVSDGVQGAFLVAVIFAGSLAGGVALIFRDLADGVGCLLGGFCLSMWFLCLKAGGLIPSTLGKSIFIGCMSIAVFSLAISSKTRNYALIGSIPFSGATATILGIDCFSRAGLKEFWIYIWDINDNEFPLNTNTYPMTRGIKVEVAGIILLFLLGLATQLKLAKMVRQRREQKDANRSQRDEDLEKEEAAVGQRVEQTIQSERVRWENVYGGGKSQTTMSGAASVDTLGKSLGSMREKRVSGMSSVELSEMSPTRETYGSKKPRTTVTVASVEDTSDGTPRSRLDATGRMLSTSSRRSARLSAGPSPELCSTESRRDSLAPPAPEVVPLPFKIPGIEIDGPRSNQGSLSAIEESFLNNRRLSSKRGSSTSYQRRSIGNVPEATVSEEDLIDDYENDDKDSSVAATFDELDEDDMSMSAMTLPRSPMDTDFAQMSPRLSHRGSFDPVSPVDVPLDLGVESESTGANANRTSLSPKEHNSGKLATVPETSDHPRSSSLGNADPMTTKSGETDSEEFPQKNRESSPPEGQQKDIKGKRQSTTTDSQAPTIGNLADHLPENVSKVVLQYRTNEWAKHLSLAEAPEPDLLAEPPSPGVKVDTSFEAESSKDRTPLSPVVDPDTFLAPVRPLPKRSSTTPSIQERPRTASVLQTIPPLQASPVISRRGSIITSARSTGQQTPPMSSLSRNNSAVKIQPAPIYTNSRNHSNPLLDQTLVESPGESPVEKGRIGKMKKVGSDIPQKETLLRQRDSQLKSKPRSKGFTQSSPNLALGQGELEEVPISQRKSQLKSGVRTSSRQDSRPPISTFDSHQPMRESSGVTKEKREGLLNNWRESLRHERKPQAFVQQAPVDEEARRARMINEKRQRQFTDEQEKLAKAARDNNLDHMMRNGNMIDVHKQALRNMQAGAKI